MNENETKIEETGAEEAPEAALDEVDRLAELVPSPVRNSRA
jgi:hypothetical protein